MPLSKPAFSSAALATCLAMVALPAWADCTRHVYNRSLDVWAFGFTDAADAQLSENAQRILPGESAEILYETGNADAPPRWMATEQITEVTGKDRYKASFSVEGCYLRHDGVTGRAVLNDPADGDIVFIE